MRVLIIKMSSMGDVVHALPAITEAREHIPEIRFDWLVEESFADIPAMHPAVDRVIPVAFRRLRKKKLAMFRDAEWQGFVSRLKDQKYDLVIDAQGLIKSAWISSYANGVLHGYDSKSAREGLASLFYKQRHSVGKELHAISRVRTLLASCLGYSVNNDAFPGYGLAKPEVPVDEGHKPYLFFLHATTWPSKQWPDAYWNKLISIANSNGYKVLMSAGGFEEMARARLIADKAEDARVLPTMSIGNLALYLGHASAVVGVDTGLAHLSAALDVPGLTIYGSTSSGKTGVVGNHHKNVDADFPCAPCLSRNCMYKGKSDVFPACYASLSPELIWQELSKLLSNRAGSN
jgi:heptosyltransferase-1